MTTYHVEYLPWQKPQDYLKLRPGRKLETSTKKPELSICRGSVRCISVSRKRVQVQNFFIWPYSVRHMEYRYCVYCVHSDTCSCTVMGHNIPGQLNTVSQDTVTKIALGCARWCVYIDMDVKTLYGYSVPC
jgi:hypothetical protein